MGMSGATNNGIQIVDITNPAAPTNISFVTTQSGAGQIDASNNDVLDIHVEGTTLYAGTYGGGLLIVDVSTPASPVILGKINLSGQSWAVNKIGNYVYVGSPTTGLDVIDVSNPASPSLVTSAATMPLRHIQVVGNKIYGSSSTSLFVIDVSTPTAPSIIGSLVVATNLAYETYYRGGYLYAVDKGSFFLRTYDVTNPASISLVNTSAVGSDDFRSIYGYGTKIYVSTGGGGAGSVRVYDVTTPATPTLDGSIALTNRGYEIMFQNGFVYTSNFDGKLQIVKVCTN